VGGATTGFAKGSNMTSTAGSAKASMMSHGGGNNSRLAVASHGPSLMENNMGMGQGSQMMPMEMSDMNQLHTMRPMQIDQRNQMNQMFGHGMWAAQQQPMRMMHQLIRMMQQQPMGMIQQQPMGMIQQQPTGMMQQQPMGMIQPLPMDMMQMHQPQMGFGTGIGAEIMGMGNCWL